MSHLTDTDHESYESHEYNPATKPQTQIFISILTLSEKCHSLGRRRLTKDNCLLTDDDLVFGLNKLDDINPVG